jgi:CRISPR-associated protein Cas2
MHDDRACMPLHSMQLTGMPYVSRRRAHRVVIAYDTPDARRRRRLARAILGRTPRIQQSVYEGDLTAAELRALAHEIQRLADVTEDSIVIAPLCTHCSKQCVWFGPNAPDRGAHKGASRGGADCSTPRLWVA